MTMKMVCPYCNKEAVWCSNDNIYGRQYGKSYMCYLCKDCNAYVGCHQNTRKPLGSMANEELRRWRKIVHGFIDPIWKSGKLKRKQVYDELSRKLGRQIHVGESNIEQCKEIIVLVKGADSPFDTKYGSFGV